MLKHPNSPSNTVAAVKAPTHIVTFFKGNIYVFTNSSSALNDKVTVSKKVAKLPHDRDHLLIVNQQFPNARYHGRA